MGALQENCLGRALRHVLSLRANERFLGLGVSGPAGLSERFKSPPSRSVLEHAFDTKAVRLVRVKVHPRFAPLRRHPRFQNLIARMHLRES